MAKKMQEGKQPCIWMAAGVIDYKVCNHNFDCTTCEFDQAISETAATNRSLRKAGKQLAGKKGNIIEWQERMRLHSGIDQKCRHMVTGRVPAYFCGNNYLCHKCSFDQMLEDQWEMFTPAARPRTQEVFGFAVPTTNYLHRGHTWAALENAGRVRIGLDDFSQKVLGPADEMQLPDLGKEFRHDAIGMALARQGKKAAVLAPIDGIIEAVNPKVREKPRLAHDDPYGDGWLFVVSPTNLQPNLESMLFGTRNPAWIENESHRLLGMLESTVGVTLPDGGAIVDDVYGHYPKLGWQRLVREFLLTG